MSFSLFLNLSIYIYVSYFFPLARPSRLSSRFLLLPFLSIFLFPACVFVSLVSLTLSILYIWILFPHLPGEGC